MGYEKYLMAQKQPPNVTVNWLVFLLYI